MPEDVTATVTPAAPASEPSSTAAPSPAPSESAAPSSSPPAEPPAGKSGQDAKETMLDAVLKVVPATTETPLLDSEGKALPETPEPLDGQAKPETEEADDDAEPAPDSGPPILRKKINKLLKHRRELRAEKQQLESQLTALKPAAETGSRLQDFARDNDLSGDDMVKGLTIMAALRRGDWQAVYDGLAQPMRMAQEYLGHAIPADLRQQVAQGQLTEQMARQVTRMRMDQQRTEVVRQAEQQAYAKRAHVQTQDQVTRSVSAFEHQIAANDPDYGRKAEYVKRVAQAKLQEKGGYISSVDEALAITKEAYDEVNATIRRLQPQPTATQRMPNGNGQTRSARPEPTTLFEAAVQGLERSRNGAGLP
jgi:vacuolar-type H+-ATPase subunit I/STV1